MGVLCNYGDFPMSDIQKLSDKDLLLEFQRTNELVTINEIVRRWCARLIAIEQTHRWVEQQNDPDGYYNKAE